MTHPTARWFARRFAGLSAALYAGLTVRPSAPLSAPPSAHLLAPLSARLFARLLARLLVRLPALLALPILLAGAACLVPASAHAKGGHGSSGHGSSGHGGSHGGSATSFSRGHSAVTPLRPATSSRTLAASGSRTGAASRCEARDERGNCVSYGARAPEPRYFSSPDGGSSSMP